MTRRWLGSMLLAVVIDANAAPRPTDTDGIRELRLDTLASTCAACHGSFGLMPADAIVPGLAGVPAAATAARMRSYRDGSPGTIMPQIARGYTDAQIDELAAYFERQPTGSAR